VMIVLDDCLDDPSGARRDNLLNEPG
jgi:hypothetical protein